MGKPSHLEPRRIPDPFLWQSSNDNGGWRLPTEIPSGQKGETVKDHGLVVVTFCFCLIFAFFLKAPHVVL
jgi:hypothetical protein